MDDRRDTTISVAPFFYGSSGADASGNNSSSSAPCATFSLKVDLAVQNGTDSNNMSSDDQFLDSQPDEEDQDEELIVNGDDNLNNETEANNETEKGEDVSQSSSDSVYYDCYDEDEFLKVPKVVRSSSLKTGNKKTPPGTPRTKKIVRFADCLGLDLTDVKIFLDEIPNVPEAALRDLKDALKEREDNKTFSQNSWSWNKLRDTGVNLMPNFAQPVASGDFIDRIQFQKILLENCFFLTTPDMTIKGTVRVLNLDFHKSVYIRYTYDEWHTFTDVQAAYVPASCDGLSDRFTFSINLELSRLKSNSNFMFCLRYHTLGQQFWDNNSGRNYSFYCVKDNNNLQY